MAVRSCWILAGTRTHCCIRIVYVFYPEHPKHAQWVTCPVSMLAMQELATIKGHSKMFSFIKQHNATSFEGTCNWHADCRNVHQSCCLWIECSFLYHKLSPKAFQTIWQYIIKCNHTSPGPPWLSDLLGDVVSLRMNPSLRLTCAIFMLSNQHLDMPYLLGGMDYLGKGEVLTTAELDSFVNNIWEKWIFCVYRKSFRSLSSANENWKKWLYLTKKISQVEWTEELDEVLAAQSD